MTLEAWIDNARQLGKLLARLQGGNVRGVRLERVQIRGRYWWQSVSVSSV
jgi:hypothetical protein